MADEQSSSLEQWDSSDLFKIKSLPNRHKRMQLSMTNQRIINTLENCTKIGLKFNFWMSRSVTYTELHRSTWIYFHLMTHFKIIHVDFVQYFKFSKSSKVVFVLTYGRWTFSLTGIVLDWISYVRSVFVFITSKFSTTIIAWLKLWLNFSVGFSSLKLWSQILININMFLSCPHLSYAPQVSVIYR